jgi:hypothetical protein
VVSFFSYQLARQAQGYHVQSTNRRIVLETLRDIKEIQDDLKLIRSGITGQNNLTEKEIILLNYYEVLSKTLAENINREPSIFTRATCNHSDSVKLRKKPSVLSDQIGGVYKDEQVVVLGTFSYNDQDIWYYVVTPDNNIGWGYRYFEINR